MHGFLRAAVLTMFYVTAIVPLRASTLEISPVLVDVMTETAAATTIRLRNRSVEPVRVQLRLHRWRQVDGEDVLRPAADGDVAVSPPFVTLKPGVENVVRVARIAKTGVAGEEAYRLLIDELPPPALPDGQVRLTMRHSVPVFIHSTTASAPRMTWRLSRENGVSTLVASNAGDRRIRVAELSIGGAGSGVDTPMIRGLAGYVLGHSSMRWVLKDDVTPVSVTFNSESGVEQAIVSTGSPSTNARGRALDTPI